MLREAVKREEIWPKDLFYLAHSVFSWQHLKAERFLINIPYFFKTALTGHRVPQGTRWLSSGGLVWLLPNTPPGLTPGGVPSLPVRAADQLPDAALQCSRKHDTFHHRYGASWNWGQEFCPEDLHSQRNLMRRS